MLEQNDVQVDQTSSGTEAIQYLKENTPDLIFMDHGLPGMDGLETTRAITSNPETETIPVVMYTSKSGPAYREKAKNHGAADIISKPPSWNRVSTVINTIVDHSFREDGPSGKDSFLAFLEADLTSLHSEIKTLFDQQIKDVRQEFRNELKRKLHGSNRGNANTAQGLRSELTPLVHSITDNKLHQLNIELRNHMSAKLDIATQDFIAVQAELTAQITDEVTKRLHAVNNNKSIKPVFTRRLYKLFKQLW